MISLALRCFAVLLVGLVAADAPGAEPWADAGMPVSQGLVIWLDAARLSEGRKALGQSASQAGDSLDAWPDASGAKRHMLQAKAAARPTYRPTGSFHAVRFDGKDDHFALVGPEKSFREMTVFVVAAPYSCPEWFSAFLALSAEGKNDFQTGLNIDQATGNPLRLETVNVEGVGSQGMLNLLKEPAPFGTVMRLCVTSAPGKNGTSLWANGKPQGHRDRAADTVIRADRLVVGARYYNLGTAPQVRGFLDGDLAEVLIFDRVLPEAERNSVEKYLADKYASVPLLTSPHGPPPGTGLVRVPNPPPVQMLLPGFTVRELPVDLTNVNNVKYRPDGTLVALGYNGVIWHLRDTDGDGLEDKAEVFWDSKGMLRSPIGMDLTPPDYKHGDGVFVVAKTRCVLIVDTDKDGKADKEIVVAEGWKESFHQVDGLGVAFDKKDGSVYFGRGTYNFADPLLKDKEGKPHYSLTDEAGAIIRVSPDFKTREIVATGIRFPVGLQFNRHGDLFATDQEGATWVPNGNPLDELLHIQKGRHYGFPARHPKHLPNVIDEPSTFDYGPQHQSTCGFCFNEPVKDGLAFGPKVWQGDALVTGESRGKLYRTQLVKSNVGYVARTQLLACLSMLTIDCCVAPDGSLVVACHSGGPDWGSGPSGKGKLFKIGYTDKDHPQPVFAVPSGPREVRVEFDRPVDVQLLRDLLRQTKLTAGRSVRAGDRFESIWPGYAVVQAQQATPRFDMPVRSAQLTPDRRSLILATDPHPAAVHYALTLPGMGRPDKLPNGVLRQVPEIDLDFDLTGCEATWIPADGTPAWVGWLPHLDLQLAREMTAGSAPHDALWAAMAKPGELTLKAKLDLVDMLRPAVQLGSKLDHEYPPEDVTVSFEGTVPLKLAALSAKPQAAKTASFTVRANPNAPVPVELRLASRGGPLTLVIHFTTNEDTRPRPLPLRRVLMPWAETDLQALGREAVVVHAPELEGGSWARGRKEFSGEQAACFKCHSIHGAGGDLAPDLSNLVYRDYASVLRDITDPSFAINPDHLTYVVQLVDGRTLTGVIRTVGENVRIGDVKGVVTEVPRADVERMTPSAISTMPVGLPKLLGPDRLRDLMAFLLTAPPKMPDYGSGKPPEARTKKEVAAVLAGAPVPPAKTRKLNIVLVAGRKDHGPGEHDYPAWKKAWTDLLAIAENTSVESSDDWPSPVQLKTADVLVFYQQGKWTPDRAKGMDAFLARGGGAVYIHYAVDGGTDAPGFARRIGLAWQGGKSKFRHGPLDLGFEGGSKHPIARNFDKVHFHDESYWNLVGNPARITLLAQGQEEGKDQPLFWTLEPSKGRVFVSIPGHFSWTFDDPLFRVLLLRGIAWTAREPVDRFNELVLPGARNKD